MILYNLKFGDFPLTLTTHQKAADFRAYFPFYLYKSRFSRIPDFLRKGAHPFLREEFDDPANKVKISKYNVSTYLNSRGNVGWYYIDPALRGDFPSVRKIIAISFDIISNNKFAQNQSFDFNFAEILLKNELDAIVFGLYVTLTLNIQTAAMGNKQFVGSLDLKYQIMKDGLNKETEVVNNFNILFNQNPGTKELRNIESNFFNDNESKLKMFSFLSKQTLVFQVSQFLIFIICLKYQKIF